MVVGDESSDESDVGETLFVTMVLRTGMRRLHNLHLGGICSHSVIRFPIVTCTPVRPCWSTNSEDIFLIRK